MSYFIIYYAVIVSSTNIIGMAKAGPDGKDAMRPGEPETGGPENANPSDMKTASVKSCICNCGLKGGKQEPQKVEPKDGVCHCGCSQGGKGKGSCSATDKTISVLQKMAQQ